MSEVIGGVKLNSISLSPLSLLAPAFALAVTYPRAKQPIASARYVDRSMFLFCSMSSLRHSLSTIFSNALFNSMPVAASNCPFIVQVPSEVSLKKRRRFSNCLYSSVGSFS